MTTAMPRSLPGRSVAWPTLATSCSASRPPGRSENVLRGLRAGHDAGAVTALLTGDAGTQGSDGVDHLVGVPSSSTSRIQELHLIVVHLLCEIVDAWAMDQGGASTRPRPQASAAAPSRPARSPSSAGRTPRSRTN